MPTRLERYAPTFGGLFKVPPLSIPLADTQQIRRLSYKASAIFRNSLGGAIIDRLDDVIKCIVAKLFDEQEVACGKNKPDFAAWGDKESPTIRLRRLKALYARAINREYLVPVMDDRRAEFCRDELAVSKVIELFHPYRFSEGFHDFKGNAFQELLRDTLDKNDNQQFFTPTEIAEFMGDVATIAVSKPLWLVRVCDPAVGSGGLLTAVVRRAIASMNGNANRDMVRRYAQSRVCGADCDDRMAWIAAVNLLLMADDSGHIMHLPGGGSLDARSIAKDGLTLEDNSVDLIVTNPPFGSDLIDARLLNQFDLGRGRPSRRRSVLFVERCLKLLKPNGICVIVLDDSVLSQRTTCDVRAWLLERADLLAVFSLPDTAFMPYATAKASILVFRRRTCSGCKLPVPTQSTLMVEIEQTGRKPNGEALYREVRDDDGRTVLDTDLPEATRAFSAFMRGGVGFSDGRPRSLVITAAEIAAIGERDSHAQADSEMANGPRIDFLRYHPLQRKAEEALRRCRSEIVSLRDLVDVRSTRINPAESPDELFRYVGLAEIEKYTGIWRPIESFGDSIKSTCNIFKGGDIIFARLRPNLRKVVLVPDDDPGGVCSSECAVLRGLDKGPVEGSQAILFSANPSSIDSGYLVWILRSDLIQGQLLPHVTGIGRPRVATSALLAARIPLPPIAEQCRVAREMDVSWKRLISARKRAAEMVAQAEKDFLTQYAKVF